MSKLTVVILSISLTFLLSGAFLQRHALACELLPVLNYRQIHQHVFLQADITRGQVEGISELITAASARIGFVYGSPLSTPRFLLISDSQTAEKWGANTTASMHRLPWRSCIVIGPNGQNVDVIAHEWLHAEIQQRVGFFRFLIEIPVWFDEGAALTVDYRPPFLPHNIALSAAQVQRVKLLERGSDFFAGDIRTHYQAARLAVEPLIINDRFFDDLQRISLGERFDSVFVFNQTIKPGTDVSRE